MNGLVKLILEWPQAIKGFHTHALAGYLSEHLNQIVGEKELQEAIAELEARQLLETQNGVFWLAEPDPPERDLYSPLETALNSEAIFGPLGIWSKPYVFQLTASGGARGDGRLSMPDFTLATIRAWRFNPASSLEVYSFEVKRRSGTSLASVYEAVAHGRFVHHPYLVCPRSRIDPKHNEMLLQACSREGIGLIHFDLDIEPHQGLLLSRVDLITKADRRSPDPELVEQHLAKRLSPGNCIRLERLARGDTRDG